MLKAIIFDFDGVILESMDIKTRAFVHVFRKYPADIQDKVRRLHLDNGGLSRFKKFEIIFEKFLGQKLDEQTKKKLGEEFAGYCYNEVVSAPFVHGMKDFLDWAKGRLDLFIVSGTPQDEIRSIVKDRKLTSYFKGVFGSPEDKTTLCQRILKDHGYASEDVLFVGDAVSDWEGAVNNQIPFIARLRDDNKALFADKNVKKVEDFVGFSEVIKNFT